MAKIVVHANGPFVLVMSQVLCLQLGVRNESDVLPALETSQSSGRNRLLSVIPGCVCQSLHRVWAQLMGHLSLSGDSG